MQFVYMVFFIRGVIVNNYNRSRSQCTRTRRGECRHALFPYRKRTFCSDSAIGREEIFRETPSTVEINSQR